MNRFFREFRKLRDEIRNLTEEEWERYRIYRIREFWDRKPWYIKALRPMITVQVYRFLKKFL